MKNKIVGIGEVLWDVLPEGKTIGGATANFAYHASQFGFDTVVVSAIGQDELGDEVVEVFAQKKLNHQLQRIDFPTGTVQITLDAQGVPKYDICESVAWDNIAFTPELEQLAKETRAVVFGSLAQRNEVSMTTINRFLDAMEGEGNFKIFDINLRQHFFTPEVIEESFKRCNVLKINDEELVVVAKMYQQPDDDFKAVCEWLISTYDLEILILTCGVYGSYVFSKEECSFAETSKVVVADTVGAGDSFTASFCSAILKGKLSLVEAHRLAVETSAFVCTQHGAMPLLPDVLTDRI